MRKSVKYTIVLIYCMLTSTLILSAVYAEGGKKYVGSSVCKNCHEDQYAGWENTLHSTVIMDVKNDKSSILGDFSEGEPKVLREKYPITHTVGSHWEQRYLTKIKDDLYILPITWSVVTKSWKDLPREKTRFWKRKPYTRYCIGCHTTNYNPKDKSYSEHTIGCESCHGPGEDHVKAEGNPDLITNPARLPESRRDMVCAQCHVRAQDKTEQYTFPVGFMPGENLADYVSIRTILHKSDEKPEDVILRVFEEWKKRRAAPKSCDVCGIEKPSDIPVHLIPQAESSPDFCASCHDFSKNKLSEHTHHKTHMDCNDCHKRLDDSDVDDNRNIHSYDYYLIHKKGCYDPLIEKLCISCHKDKVKSWATPYVIDWSVPVDFSVHED